MQEAPTGSGLFHAYKVADDLWPFDIDLAKFRPHFPPHG